VIQVEIAISCVFVRAIYSTASGTSTSPKPCLPTCSRHCEVSPWKFSERSEVYFGMEVYESGVVFEAALVFPQDRN